MEIQSVIEIRELQKSYQGFLLDLPALQIPKGFATALIGENGAGKSTLLNILAGIRLDYRGTLAYFNGETDESLIREQIAYTGTGNYFMPHWTVTQIAEVSSLLFEHFHRDRYQAICQELGVTAEDKRVRNLSDGMRMKVALAAAFARDTKLLLLDEPASPLDPLMRDKLCSMLQDYLEDGERSVLFSTHNISDMEQVTDYAIIMEQGRVVEQGFVEDLKERYILVRGEAVDADRAQDILYSFRQNSYGYEGLCRSENLDRLAGMDISIETPTLSQISVAVMKQYTGLKM